MVQAPAPVHAPVHPAKTELAFCFAVSVTELPLAKLAIHVEPQIIPDGVLVTVPPPAPALWTVSSVNGTEVKWGEPPQPARNIQRKAPERRRKTAFVRVMQKSCESPVI
jgi:hypothetical protein